jgi:hypothetical protein
METAYTILLCVPVFVILGTFSSLPYRSRSVGFLHTLIGLVAYIGALFFFAWQFHKRVHFYGNGEWIPRIGIWVLSVGFTWIVYYMLKVLSKKRPANDNPDILDEDIADE